MKSGHDEIRLKNKANMSWPLFCQHLFDAAIGAVTPARCIPPYLPDTENYSAVRVIAVGKDAAEMAAVVEDSWASHNLSGLIICPRGRAPERSIFDVIESAHPVPDENSVLAAGRAIEIASSVTNTELLLILISGGGSALMSKPVEGLTLEDKQHVIEALLKSGANINEINAVRRVLSGIKGGKLLVSAARAKKVVTLAVSDVVGDNPQIIASGPTVVGYSDEIVQAQAVLGKYGITLPETFTWPNMPHPSALPDHTYQIIAGGSQMLAAAEKFLSVSGFSVINLGTDVEGEARDVALEHAEKILSYCRDESPGKPAAFISGGELTVTIKGNGLGGPNQEYILALKAALPEGEFYAFAADTDGIDGQGGACGAMFAPASYAAAAALGLTMDSHLVNNDSLSYFNKIGDIFKPKNDVMNVNDLRVICWLPASHQGVDH